MLANMLWQGGARREVEVSLGEGYDVWELRWEIGIEEDSMSSARRRCDFEKGEEYWGVIVALRERVPPARPSRS